MGAHPDTDLERANNRSNISLNQLIRTEVRAALQAEVTSSKSSPPAYSSFNGVPSDDHALDGSSSTQAANDGRLPQTPIRWYYIILSILPWIIIFSSMLALRLTVDKQAISTIAFSMVLISYLASGCVLMIIGLIFEKSFPATTTPKKPKTPEARKSNFVLLIWISWQFLMCYGLFGYMLYYRFLGKNFEIGSLYGEAKAFEGFLGVEGAVGKVVLCLQGRGDGRGANVTMVDLNACFTSLGVEGS